MTKRMGKSKLRTYVVWLFILCTAAIFCFAGCVSVNPMYPATGLEWVSSPKVLYLVGEEFDPLDAAIQITYNDDSTRKEVKNLKDISGAYTLENFSTAERVFDKEVTLKYGDLQLTFYIDVVLKEDLKTVTFHPENGTDPFTKTVVIGKRVDEPTAPTKKDLVLQDWVLESGAVFNFLTYVQEDISVHARYCAEYVFYTQGRITKTLRVTEGQSVNVSDVPTIAARTGYTVAWRFNNSGKVLDALNPLEMKELPLAETFYEGATKHMRFDAVFIPDTYNVTVDVMGGSINPDQFFDDGNGNKNLIFVPFGFSIQKGMELYGKNYQVLSKENVTKQDGESMSSYTFAGWYTKDGNGNFENLVDITKTPIDQPIIIYARWQYAVTFAKAEVATVSVEGQFKIVIRNNYELLGTDKSRYVTVFADEGKGLLASDIPKRVAEEYNGFDRWWYKNGKEIPGNQPDSITDREHEQDVATITATVGTPSEQIIFYETFYQIKYEVEFHIGEGTVTGGVALTIPGKLYGGRLLPSEVPGSESLSYNKNGSLLKFYNWYLDEAMNTVFDQLLHGIDTTYAEIVFEGGVTKGKFDLYADYIAELKWVDLDPTGEKGGSIAEAATRLSKNNVTRALFPALKSTTNYDRDWYLEESGATLAFNENGSLKKLTSGTIYAFGKLKEYRLTFDLKNSEGAEVLATIPNQNVKAGEAMLLPKEYSYWDAQNNVQMFGEKDTTGKWEIEGYYKDAKFTERYTFKTVEIDSKIIVVSNELFDKATTIYVRYMRVATEGFIFQSYADNEYYVQKSPQLSNLDEIVVPEKYRGKPVVGVDNEAFKEFKAANIYTPATIKEVRDEAFWGCQNLAMLPQMTKDCKLGEKVFHGTAWYAEEWKKPYAVSGRYILLNTITLYEYKDGTNYEAFTVPEGVEIIGTKAFDANQKLTAVVLPLTLRILRDKAFYAVVGDSVTGFRSIKTVLKFASGTSSEPLDSNIELIESGAFYRLLNLEELEIRSTKYRTFDNVLYAMEAGEKNSLVTYATRRATATYTSADGQQTYTYYIIEETVASIRQDAFSANALDVVVFRRGRTSAISATTLSSDFATQFGGNTVFLVPYSLDAEGRPIVKSFYDNAWLNDSRVRPDAFEVSFKAPQATAFATEGEWEKSVYYSFADTLSGYYPNVSETLRLNGLYSDYQNGEFSSKYAEDTKVYFDITTYEEWFADMTFTARDVLIANLSVPLGLVFDEEQLARIAIPKLEGKNSEWKGFFRVFENNIPKEKHQELFFGNFSGKAVRYGGNYVSHDTDIVYHVYLKDPYFTDAKYDDFSVTYGNYFADKINENPSVGDVDKDILYLPTRDGLEFGGWFFGTVSTHAFERSVNFGAAGNAFTEELVKNSAGAPEADGRFPVYLYARWYVIVSFYQTSVSADGTISIPKQASFSTKSDYGANVALHAPEPIDGFIGTWANYQDNVLTDLTNQNMLLEVKANCAVYTNYKRQIVSVTFKTGATDIVLNDVGYGAAIPKNKMPQDPTKSGAMFDDWYYDTAFTNRFDANRAIYENLNIYARFVTISSDANYYNLLNPTEPNGAGLVLEKVSENDQVGSIQFRLTSARNFLDKTLYLPTEIFSIVDGNRTKMGTLSQIQAGAFNGNNVIEHIIIGNSVINIALGAFRNMPKLRKISAVGNSSYQSIDGVLYGNVDSKSTLIKYPSAKESTAFTLPAGYGFGEYSFEKPENLNRIIIEGGKPYVAVNAFSGMVWENFKIFVPMNTLNSYCNKDTKVYDSDWLREISATYIERVFQSSTVVVSFQNTLTGADAYKLSGVPLNGTIADPGIIADPTGYTFDGWCTDKAGLRKYVFGQPVTDSMTLYARFVRNRTTNLGYMPIQKTGGGIAGYEVSIGTATDENIVIPNFYEGYPVIKIAENGFLDTKITSLEIPYSIEEIGSGALVGLTSLVTVSVNTLGGKVDSKNFIVASNILYNKDRTKLILYPAMAEATTFTVPTSVTAIGEYAFYGSVNLTTITLPQSVTEIGNNAFNRATKLAKLSINAPSVVSLQDSNAFSGTSVDFKVFVARSLLPNYQANGTPWANVKSKIYGNTATISYYKNFEDTETISVVEKETFKYAVEPNYASDTDLHLIIDNPPVGKSFKNWKIRNLGVTGTDWDFGLNLLTRDVELYAVWIVASEASLFVDTNSSSQRNAVLSLSSNADRSISTLTIPSVFNGKPVTEIAAGGFQGLTNLTTVVFPASLLTIQKDAFKGCVRLAELTLPESCQIIGEGAFENCALLKSVRLPSNLTALAKNVFKDCGALSKFDFGKANITTIGDGAFYGCSSLTGIVFPASLQQIGVSVFEKAINLVSISIPARVTSVGDRAFFGASKLQRVDFVGNSVATLGISAFQGCTALSTVRIPTTLNTISANLFYGNTALTKVEIPDSVKFIGGGAFQYCNNLLEVKIGNGVTQIGTLAFSGTGIGQLDLPATLDTIGENAFSLMPNLQKVYVKGAPVSIGQTIFGDLGKKPILKVYAETDEVYAAYLSFSNFVLSYEKRILKRWINITYQYLDGNGQVKTKTLVSESDKLLEEPNIKGSSTVSPAFGDFGYPTGGDEYMYKEGFWRYVRLVDNVEKSTVWDFKTELVTTDMVLVMQYLLTPSKSGENSDGLIYRIVSGDAWEVVSIGSLTNRSTIVIPNYYQKKPVVSIASSFLNAAKAQNIVLVIPDTVIKIAEDALRSNSIKKIVLENNDKNTKFRVENDALYTILSDTEVKLLRYPSTLNGNGGEYQLAQPTFQVKTGTTVKLTVIGEYAFEYNRFNRFEVNSELPFHVTDDALYEGAAGSLSKVLVSYPNLKSLENTAEEGTFTLPFDIERIYKSALSLTLDSQIKKFAVAKNEEKHNETYFADSYGVLYRIDDGAATLIRMPVYFTTPENTYTVGEGLLHKEKAISLVAIAEGAFENVMGLKTIVFAPTDVENPPTLLSTNAFKNCSAYLLVENDAYDEFQKHENWKNSVLFKRYSFVMYDTNGILPQDIANKYLPTDFSGARNGFVKRVQSITYIEELNSAINAELRGLLRVPYSEIGGWYYDQALTTKVDFTLMGDQNLVKSDMTLYAQWVVDKKSSRPQATEEGQEQRGYFTFYPVFEDGATVSYEVAFQMSSGITNETEVVIPSYHSPDGTEKNKLPVTGFYDDGTANTIYNGFSNIEALVLPETFRKFRNIFKTTGEGIIAPRRLVRLIILSKEKNYLQPERILQTTQNDLQSLVALINNGDFSYYFHDYTTYSAYRQNNVWGTSAAIRGKLISTLLDFRVENPVTSEVTHSYLNLQAGVESISAYANYTSFAKNFEGYTFVRWEMYSVQIVDGKETLTFVSEVDPLVTKFGAKAQPSPTAENDRIVLKAVYRIETA